MWGSILLIPHDTNAATVVRLERRRSRSSRFHHKKLDGNLKDQPHQPPRAKKERKEIEGEENKCKTIKKRKVLYHHPKSGSITPCAFMWWFALLGPTTHFLSHEHEQHQCKNQMNRKKP